MEVKYILGGPEVVLRRLVDADVAWWRRSLMTLLMARPWLWALSELDDIVAGPALALGIPDRELDDFGIGGP